MAVDILSATKVKKLRDGKHSDGRGLYLFVRGASRIWTFRYTDPVTGKRNEISLGKSPDVSLATARERREDARKAIAAGAGPSNVKTPASDHSVATLVAETFEAKKGELKRDGEAGRWLSPVKVHILPKLGSKDVTKLTAIEVRDVLAPIWKTKTAAAAKAMDRLGITLRHAAAKYPGEMDVNVVANARTLLGSQGHTVTHIPSMPWADVPAFYAGLGETATELSMRLLILTASRASPVRLAHVDQFDGDVWTVPAANMKGGKTFRIPLSDEAQRVVALAGDGFLFSTSKRGGERGPISDMAQTKYLRQRGLDYRPHGYRSSFRTWAGEQSKDWTLAEVSLDHSVGNKVQRSYQRSDLLEQRRPLMTEWANHVTGNQD